MTALGFSDPKASVFVDSDLFGTQARILSLENEVVLGQEYRAIRKEQPFLPMVVFGEVETNQLRTLLQV